ncbi:hypothetical protein N7452_000343 [Penicillium brevicompactum]|uniref:Copper-fist domain-containing protein n=1 Tax=Penicillium brevicompactum TaxID=5074 RepID=A0A9W9UP03_PENBR|nr:hypothetical protein N7452_000343 [Penicillium brevicompactum]
MPLDEEGAKWSCEPCIRGHRSSKCQHFDRLMMKVPKAGRPLAKCPHPKGTCSCQKTYAVMVRIPKGSSCLCRPLYEVPMDGNETTQSPTSSVPSTSSPAPGKVQKSGRRQSTMQAAPQNIARALDNMPHNLKFEDGATGFMSNRPLHPDLDDSTTPSSLNNGQAASPQDPAKQSPSPPVSSCCAQKPKADSPTPAPATAKTSQPVQNGGSCCGSRPAAASQLEHQEPNKQSFQQPPAWNDQSYMQYSNPQMASWQSPTPVPHGSYMHPAMGQAQPQQTFSQNGYMQMLPPHSQPSMSHNGMSLGVTPPPTSMAYHNSMNGLGITQPPMNSLMVNQPQSSFAAAPGGDPCHDCSCGEDCQCLGCAAHPFNTTTRKHVQEMGAMITLNGDERRADTINPYQSSPFQGAAPSGAFPYYVQSTPHLDHGFQSNPYNGYSDPNSALPSGYSSPLASSNHQINQQLMHPSEYYTLEYPVGLPSACSDVTGSCQCGSDCSCVGCLTHSGHSGFSLDMSVPENPVSDTTELRNSPHLPPTSSAMSHPSQNPSLDNMSVPCLSPRTLETSMI